MVGDANRHRAILFAPGPFVCNSVSEFTWRLAHSIPSENIYPDSALGATMSDAIMALLSDSV